MLVELQMALAAWTPSQVWFVLAASDSGSTSPGFDPSSPAAYGAAGLIFVILMGVARTVWKREVDLNNDLMAKNERQTQVIVDKYVPALEAARGVITEQARLSYEQVQMGTEQARLFRDFATEMRADMTDLKKEVASLRTALRRRSS